jgi:hypothetical protein
MTISRIEVVSTGADVDGLGKRSAGLWPRAMVSAGRYGRLRGEMGCPAASCLTLRRLARECRLGGEAAALVCIEIAAPAVKRPAAIERDHDETVSLTRVRGAPARWLLSLGMVAAFASASHVDGGLVASMATALGRRGSAQSGRSPSCPVPNDDRAS